CCSSWASRSTRSSASAEATNPLSGFSPRWTVTPPSTKRSDSTICTRHMMCSVRISSNHDTSRHPRPQWARLSQQTRLSPRAPVRRRRPPKARDPPRHTRMMPRPAYDNGMGDGLADAPGERIAVAVGRLRTRGVAVEVSAQETATRYEAARSSYRLVVYVDPSRFIGLEFDLLGADESVRLHYFADTGLYDIS